MIKYHFAFGRRTHEIAREDTPSWIAVDSDEFISVLNSIAEYKLDGDDLQLAGYIRRELPRQFTVRIRCDNSLLRNNFRFKKIVLLKKIAECHRHGDAID